MEILDGVLGVMEIISFDGGKNDKDGLTRGARIVKTIAKIVFLITLLWAAISLSIFPQYMRLGKFLLVFSIVGIIAAITTIVIITYYIPSLSGDKNFIFFFAFSMMLLAPLIASVMNCAIVTQTSSYKLYQ
jgi:hypothetical protein